MKRQSFFRLVGALVAIVLVLGACSSSPDSPEDSSAQPGTSETDRPEEGAASGDGEAPADGAAQDMTPDPLAMVTTYPGDLAEEMAIAIGSLEPGQSVLAAITTVNRTRVPFERDGQMRNASGARVVLDTATLQACGNAEIALVLAQEANDSALAHLVAAAEMVRSSEQEWSDAWADLLEDTVLRGATTELAPLVALLSLCVAGGYEL